MEDLEAIRAANLAKWQKYGPLWPEGVELPGEGWTTVTYRLPPIDTGEYFEVLLGSVPSTVSKAMFKSFPSGCFWVQTIDLGRGPEDMATAGVTHWRLMDADKQT